MKGAMDGGSEENSKEGKEGVWKMKDGEKTVR